MHKTFLSVPLICEAAVHVRLYNIPKQAAYGCLDALPSTSVRDIDS